MIDVRHSQQMRDLDIVQHSTGILAEPTPLTGETVTTTCERSPAHLIHHETDHLNGLLHTARMRVRAYANPVEEYRQTSRA